MKTAHTLQAITFVCLKLFCMLISSYGATSAAASTTTYIHSIPIEWANQTPLKCMLIRATLNMNISLVTQIDTIQHAHFPSHCFFGFYHNGENEIEIWLLFFASNTFAVFSSLKFNQQFHVWWLWKENEAPHYLVILSDLIRLILHIEEKNKLAYLLEINADYGQLNWKIWNETIRSVSLWSLRYGWVCLYISFK